MVRLKFKNNVYQNDDPTAEGGEVCVRLEQFNAMPNALLLYNDSQHQYQRYTERDDDGLRDQHQHVTNQNQGVKNTKQGAIPIDIPLLARFGDPKIRVVHRNCARGHRDLARWGMALASFPFP